MKIRNIEIERWEMNEFIDAIVEKVGERITIDLNCEDLSPCLPCESEWLTTEEVLKALKTSRPTLDKMRQRDDIEHRKVGRTYRYRI